MANKKILLVDDSATVLLMEKMILANGPYDLVVAKDGQEGGVRGRSDPPPRSPSTSSPRAARRRA